MCAICGAISPKMNPTCSQRREQVGFFDIITDFFGEAVCGGLFYLLAQLYAVLNCIVIVGIGKGVNVLVGADIIVRLYLE